MFLLYSTIVALVVALIVGPLLVPFLFKMKFGQFVREDGPQSHFHKAGTPTMGGLLFLLSAAISSLVFAHDNKSMLLVLGATLAFSLIGFFDDYIKVVLKRSLGLKAREKLVGQIGLSLIVAVLAVYSLGRGTDLLIPFTNLKILLPPWVYLIFATVLTVGVSNAVNLTDGLDGLAAGSMTFSCMSYMFIASVMSNQGFGVAIFSAALLGGLLGFLRYNLYPAKVFMGDTGSLALGAALATMAIMTKTELFLVFIGFVYMIEVLSVIIQVISFKTTGKRVFKMSPLHHHFELSGWSEKKVVLFFWFLSFLGSLIGIMALDKIG